MRKLTPFIFSLVVSIVQAQQTDTMCCTNLDETKLLFESNRLIEEQDFALQEFVALKLVGFQPENPNYLYRLAYSKLMQLKDLEVCEDLMLRASRKTGKSIDMFSIKENAAPVDAWYYLGYINHLKHNFQQAIEYYNLFQSLSIRGSQNLKLSQIRKQQCLNGIELSNSPVKLVVQNAGSGINTMNEEYSPIYSLLGDSLLFTSRRPWGNSMDPVAFDNRKKEYFEDVYLSHENGSQWICDGRIPACRQMQNEACIGSTQDESTLYLYSDSVGNGDIFELNGWTFDSILALNVPGVNTHNWETHVSISSDRKWLYFVSDKPGGFGGRDIYFKQRRSDGSWSPDMNLGPSVNTEFDEDSPFITLDKNVLYYSSNGMNSIGGFDIMKVGLSEGRAINKGVNIGIPLNSAFDDVFLTFDNHGSLACFSSNRLGGYGKKDLYFVKGLHSVNKNYCTIGVDLDVLGNYNIEDLKLELKKLNDHTSFEYFPRKTDGKVLIPLLKCEEYELTLLVREKRISSKQINLPCDSLSDCPEQWMDVELYDNDSVVFGIDRKFVVIRFVDDQHRLVKNTELNMDSAFWENKGMQFGVNGELYSLKKLTFRQVVDLERTTFLISAEGFLSQSHHLSTPINISNDTLTYEIILVKDSIGLDLFKHLALNPIYFDYRKWDIRKDAAKELDKIVEILKLNPGLVISINAHTDTRGEANENQRLSEKRAKSCYNYLLKHGIKKNHLKYKGYGEQKTAVKYKDFEKCNGDYNCIELLHQKNRRIEFLILTNLN